MNLNFPTDIKAEIVSNYIGLANTDISFLGNHKRNTYKDILSASVEDDVVKIQMSRPGVYDILPEALFHPIDRFDNIPSNEYKERFDIEIEQQRIEESSARSFFYIFDKFIFGLSSIVKEIKQTGYGDNRILSDIICDSLPDKYKSNRFVNKAIEFVPRCQSMRGNINLITIMLRKILSEEGLRLDKNDSPRTFTDNLPRYNCNLQEEESSKALYLGNCYDEDVISFDIQYWNEDYCNESFLNFVKEMEVFEDFINDFFMGLETFIHFNISTDTLPVRLSADMCHNYLNYNTNL